MANLIFLSQYPLTNNPVGFDLGTLVRKLIPFLQENCDTLQILMLLLYVFTFSIFIVQGRNEV